MFRGSCPPFPASVSIAEMDPWEIPGDVRPVMELQPLGDSPGYPLPELPAGFMDSARCFIPQIWPRGIYARFQNKPLFPLKT